MTKEKSVTSDSFDTLSILSFKVVVSSLKDGGSFIVSSFL